MNMPAVLKRKLDTFKRDPAYAVKMKLLDSVKIVIAPIRRMADRTIDREPLLPQEVYKERLAHAGALNAIELFHARRPKDSFPPEYNDLWFLYSAVRKYRPKVLVELGSGVSTAVLAKAVEDNADNGFLYSIDAVNEWAESTRASMPVELKGFYEILYSPAQEVTYHCSCGVGVRAFRHQQLPDIVPDFLYLDGPPLNPDVIVSVDVLDLEPKLERGFHMIIDGRQENMHFLRRNLTRRYAFKWRPHHQSSIWELRD